VIPAVDSENRPTLRRGDRGDAVELVQTTIGISVNGVFDVITEAAVRAFQRDNGLVPDGIVGPRTWATLMIRLAPI
jgi:peptidoglycan hydrolase-like protein with peptidoglycan-binding domain